MQIEGLGCVYSHNRGCSSISRRVAKFNPKVGSRRTTKIKIWSSSSLFGCPHFVTLLHVCGTSSHTAVFVGKIT